MFKRFWWVFLVTLILGPLAGVFFGGVIAYISPKTFESSATIQVRPVTPSVQVLPGHVSHDPSATPSNFFATEFEVIRSQATLDRVIDQLDLMSRWGMPRPEVLEKLRQSIDTRNIKGTDLIEIRVRTTNPEDSRLIAGAVSDAYRSRRLEIEHTRSDRVLEELRKAVREQEDRVEEKRKVLTGMIRNESLLWPPDANAPTYPRGSGAAAQYAELETQKIKLESQIDILLRYEGEQLITYAAELNLPENIIRTLRPQWLAAKRQLEAAKQAGLGDDHPTVKQQTKIIAGLDTDLKEGVVALRETLRAQLELVKEQAERLRIRKEEEEDRAVTPGIARYTFDDAKAEFEAAQSLLEQLKVKLISEEMQRRISEDPVVVHAQPAEAMRPASPNVPLHLLLGAAGGLLLGLIAPFAIIPILHAANEPKPA